MKSHYLHIAYSEVAVPELLLTEVGYYFYKFCHCYFDTVCVHLVHAQMQSWSQEMLTNSMFNAMNTNCIKCIILVIFEKA